MKRWFRPGPIFEASFRAEGEESLYFARSVTAPSGGLHPYNSVILSGTQECHPERSAQREVEGPAVAVAFAVAVASEVAVALAVSVASDVERGLQLRVQDTLAKRVHRTAVGSGFPASLLAGPERSPKDEATKSSRFFHNPPTPKILSSPNLPQLQQTKRDPSCRLIPPNHYNRNRDKKARHSAGLFQFNHVDRIEPRTEVSN